MKRIYKQYFYKAVPQKEIPPGRKRSTSKGLKKVEPPDPFGALKKGGRTDHAERKHGGSLLF
jgi:hypothetical protein